MEWGMTMGQRSAGGGKKMEFKNTPLNREVPVCLFRPALEFRILGGPIP
jgi:hypothetical protein